MTKEAKREIDVDGRRINIESLGWTDTKECYELLGENYFAINPSVLKGKSHADFIERMILKHSSVKADELGLFPLWIVTYIWVEIVKATAMTTGEITKVSLANLN